MSDKLQISGDPEFAAKTPAFFPWGSVIKYMVPSSTPHQKPGCIDLSFKEPLRWDGMGIFQAQKPENGALYLDYTQPNPFNVPHATKRFAMRAEIALSIKGHEIQYNPLSRWDVNALGMPRQTFNPTKPDLPRSTTNDVYLMMLSVVADHSDPEAIFLRAWIRRVMNRIKKDPEAISIDESLLLYDATLPFLLKKRDSAFDDLEESLVDRSPVEKFTLSS